MKKNGFTLVEVLAVLIVLGILLVLTIPAYMNVFSAVKRDNYNSKMKEIISASEKYGNRIKDEVKDAGDTCKTVTIPELIQKGYLVSEDQYEDIIINPADNLPMEGIIKICYCTDIYDINAHYTVEFKENKPYHKDDVVEYEGKLYKCTGDYPGHGGITATYHEDPKDNSSRIVKYFIEMGC